MQKLHSLVRRAAAGALVVAVSVPAVGLAASCSSVGVECALDLTGKRYVNGQESSVRCRASAGHVASYRAADPDRGTDPVLILSVAADDPACDAVFHDIRPVVPELGGPRVERPAVIYFVGGSEDQLNSKGKSTNSCVLAMTNVNTIDADEISPFSHGHVAGSAKLDELEPGVTGIASMKADVMYRRQPATDTSVLFIGSVKLSECISERAPE